MIELAVHRLIHSGRTFAGFEAHETCNKMPISLRTLCLVTLVLCNIHGSLEHEIPRRSFLSRRAIDGTRGRKYFDPEEEGAFDSYGSAGGQYDPFEEKTDLSDIRRNVPGEPGIDYPAYTTLPQTGFTCEGRSRGYYADVVAGCQVFHVCHDVLVSSFLCPIGSIFSQKLLTCDWWTKVDCPSSEKYIDVNRNSYQQDDDEMIRNAYAMISLQAGTDVTEDGLVDPDSIGSIIDYQRGPGKVLDFPRVDNIGNDLKNSFDDYVNTAPRNFLPMFKQFKEKKPETSRNYQEKFFPREKFPSPFQESPIIRIQKINEEKEKDFQENYRRPNEFGNHFQPSYAPTVPTVTTTTRRFYSPTVPTTFKPSTVAYNKLDQLIDSSDFFFSHSRSKGFVTPPTRIFPEDGKGVPLRKINLENSGERAQSGFQVRVLDDFRLNRTDVHRDRYSLFRERFPGYEEDIEDEGNLEDFETRGSIGLGHALRGISIPQQNPVKGKAKEESNSEVAGIFKPNSSQHSSNFYEAKDKSHRHTLDRPESTVSTDENGEETTEQYQRDDLREGFDVVTDLIEEEKNDFLISSTTPSVIESTIKASTASKEFSILPEKASTNSKSESSKEDVDRIDAAYHTFRPTEFLKPPEVRRTKFQIKVPDFSDVSSLLVRYSTIDDGPYPGMSTTELPRFQSTFSDDYIHQPTSYDETVAVTDNYETEEATGNSNFQNYPTTVDQLESKIHSKETSSLTIKRDEGLSLNKTGEQFEDNRTKKLELATEDIVQDESKVLCSREQGKRCEHPATENFAPLSVTSFEKAIDEVTLPPSSLHSLESTTIIDTSEEMSQTANGEILKSTTGISQRVNIESSESVSKTVAHRSVDESKESREEESKRETVDATTANSLIKLIKPETLKHIEETIEKNNSPYQVTLTVNSGEKLLSEDDLISKLITEQGKDSTTLSDRAHQLEIVKSVEPELQSINHSSTVNIFESTSYTTKPNNSTTAWPGKQSLNTVSLLQLMTELLKLDRAPRPFSLAGPRNFEQTSRSLEEVVSTTQAFRDKTTNSASDSKNNEEKATTKLVESSTESKTSTTLSKQHILGQLTENFGEALYKTDPQLVFDVPERQRALDFQTGLPLRILSTDNMKPTFSATTRPPPTTTTTQKNTLTTEAAKTIVKTEFIPSIGFSLDTDEGREEYVEAVLGGLIDSQPTESEKKETNVLATAKELALQRNETSGKV